MRAPGPSDMRRGGRGGRQRGPSKCLHVRLTARDKNPGGWTCFRPGEAAKMPARRQLAFATSPRNATILLLGFPPSPPFTLFQRGRGALSPSSPCPLNRVISRGIHARNINFPLTRTKAEKVGRGINMVARHLKGSERERRPIGRAA